MKKILVLIDDHVPKDVLEYAVHLARYEKATIYGLFVYNSKDSVRYGFELVNTINEEEGLQNKSERIRILSDTCNAAGVNFQINNIYNNFLDALIDQSVFADLIICDSGIKPTLYSIKTLLADSHCPVLLLNKGFVKPDTIVLTYDDKATSMHAIKLFTYLFRFYNNLPVHFVSVVPRNVLGIEYEDLIREWLPLQYPNATLEILKGETKEELPRFINNQVNPLVIMGAFGRSSLSRFFKESLANVILEKTNAPLFIAHD